MDYIPVGHLALWKELPKGKSKAIVLIVHGVAEHSARHLNTQDALLAEGYTVVRFDLRGAGKSGGRRQWVSSFNDYVEDVNTVLNWIHRELEEQPIFVLGHSLGGAISTFFAAKRSQELKGLILSAPAFLVGESISPLRIKIGRLLTKIAPKLRIPAPVESPSISRDKAIVKDYAEDPLNCHFNTVQQGKEILDSLELMPQRAAEIKCPVLIVHGGADKLIKVEGSQKLLEAIRSPSKELVILPEGYHEPHNDLDKERYFEVLTRWLKKQLLASS